MSKFGSLTIISDLDRIKLSDQNNLRCYFVDNKIIKIDKDTDEPEYRYVKRVAFTLGRSINPKAKLDELIKYSRLYVNKLWSHKITDDETGKKVVVPYYGDVEKRYEMIKKLEYWIV